MDEFLEYLFVTGQLDLENKDQEDEEENNDEDDFSLTFHL